ncbi:MAG: DUF6279 family lipoprotein [bacterium]|nr:DUF6279 family lipoprotein [bacterium]
MKQPFKQQSSLKKLGLALVLLALVVGCSRLKLGYQWADVFILYQMDRYLDLNDTQEDQATAQIDELLAWHRQEELPQYAAFIGQIKTEFQEGLDLASMDRLFKGFEVIRNRLYHKILPEVALWLEQLSPAQIEHLHVELNQENDELAEEIQEPAEELREKRVEKGIKNLERWLGYLNSAQETQARQFFASLPSTGAERLAFRQSSHQELFALLSQPERAKGTLLQFLERQWLGVYQREPRLPYHQKLYENQQAYRTFLTDFAQTLEARQKERFVHKIDLLIADLKELSDRN